MVSIRDKIYEVRGVKVMLDFELAEIYGYSTKNFNRQVKNNLANTVKTRYNYLAEDVASSRKAEVKFETN